MLFGLVHRVEPLKDVLDREGHLLVAELLDEALTDREIAASIASEPDISADPIRSDALANTEKILSSASSEEGTLHDAVKTKSHYGYDNRHWAGPRSLVSGALWLTLNILVLLAVIGGTAVTAGLLVYDWTSSWLWTIVLGSLTLIAFLVVLVLLEPADRRHTWRGTTANVVGVAAIGYAVGYAGYRLAGESWLGGAVAAILIGFIVIFSLLEYVDTERQVVIRHGQIRYRPTSETRAAFEAWRHVLREEGVLGYLRGAINHTLLSRYSTVLSVRDAPGLRYLGDLKYHVPTSARSELIRRVSGVDGGSFALAGPRGAGKTILIRALCEGRYNTGPGQDLGIVVSAPVDYHARDFVLYLYTEVCKATTDYLARLAPAAPRRRFLRRSKGDNQLNHHLAKMADDKLNSVRYLQSFSTELSVKGGVKYAELSAKAATNLAEQPLTYPEIVADLRGFLHTVAQTVDGKVLIGLDELDRIGSGERARKFLDDIKAIFWIRGCYFLVSVSEDALQAFELSGHGLRDAFDSAFDEVIVVEHLDFEASTTLLRARVTGMPLPYHALAYCLSGGLPRELMRATRAIVDQQTAEANVRIGRVTANLVSDELARVRRAARLALAGAGAEAAKAAELLRRLDEGCGPSDAELTRFADEVVDTAAECSDPIRSLAGRVATHARYLAALAAVFGDQLTEADIRRATDASTPAEARFDALARARRYLGVNDPFAGMLIGSFRKTWI